MTTKARFQRGDMILRTIAAVPLGYATASLWSMALARLLPMRASEATVAAALVAIALCAVFAMWAFAARTGWRAVWTLGLSALVAGGIAWGSIVTGGRA